MSGDEARNLVEMYKQALLNKFFDFGDHPSKAEKLDAELARVEALLINELTDFHLPIG